MNDSTDAAYFRKRLFMELEASRRAAQPQIGWLHFDMAKRYAALIAKAETQTTQAEERALNSMATRLRDASAGARACRR